MTTILNLGAGVQSTVLLLMALEGELPQPDYVVFADTGWEPQATYRHLEWLKTRAAQDGMTIDTVSAGNIYDDLVASHEGKRWVSIPFFIDTKDRPGMIKRQCTKEYKVQPLIKYSRPRAEEVERWIGMSLDESCRMRVSKEWWATNRWPLIERNMTRGDCIQWLRHHDYPIPPKSSCVCCPFHDNIQWRELMLSEDREKLVSFDRMSRRMPTMRGDCYLHRSLKPLEDIDFSSDVDNGQLVFDECMGICGT